jgi:hypothetical protein
LLEALPERYPDQYPDKLLHTLQRRVKHWKALHGKEKEVMFRQVYAPGLLGLSDFTQLKGVAITIGGEPLAHRLYHFRLRSQTSLSAMQPFARIMGCARVVTIRVWPMRTAPLSRPMGI